MDSRLPETSSASDEAAFHTEHARGRTENKLSCYYCLSSSPLRVVVSGDTSRRGNEVGSMQRRWRFSVLVLLVVTMSVVSACGTASTSPSGTPLERWMAATPMYIAHRGGDGDWPEATGYAYAHATAWNPNLALEVPVWRTSDGVWVVSEDATTGRVFGANLPIPATRWAILSTLRSSRGSYPMARLVNDVLDVYGSNRILFIDNKADTNVTAFFDLLDSYGGRTRCVMKRYWQSVTQGEVFPILWTRDQGRKLVYVAET